MNNFETEKAFINLSRELKAVLLIFNADDELKRKALTHLNMQSQEIDWYSISQNDFGGGHSGAIAWAKAIWSDQITEGADPFERAFAMQPRLQNAVIEALKSRWGLLI